MSGEPAVLVIGALGEPRIPPTGDSSPARPVGRLVVHPRDEGAPPKHLDRDAAEPDVEARVLREEDLVTRFDAARVRAYSRHDPRARVSLGARRNDQAVARLDFLVQLLDDDVVVERLEGDPNSMGRLLHDPIVGSPRSGVDARA